MGFRVCSTGDRLLSATIRHAIIARYNLEVASQRTTQEEYLVGILSPVLAENCTLMLTDPVHRNALARELAKRTVIG
jgi:hypothetical protein